MWCTYNYLQRYYSDTHFSPISLPFPGVYATMFIDTTVIVTPLHLVRSHISWCRPTYNYLHRYIQRYSSLFIAFGPISWCTYCYLQRCNSTIYISSSLPVPSPIVSTTVDATLIHYSLRGFLMSPPCLESQGCQFHPTLIYLLSCSSALSCRAFCLIVLCRWPILLNSFPLNLYFPEGRLFCVALGVFFCFGLSG